MATEPDLRHHGDRELGAGLVDLAVNVRVPEPPVWLTAALAAQLPQLGAYPDPRAAARAVAERHGRHVEEVLVTAGAAEAFTLVARALRPGVDVHRVVVVHPQFTEPEVALTLAGHTVERILLRADQGFALDPSEVPADADLVVVGNPTNPTSVLHPAQEVLRLLAPGRTLLVDEAFMDTVEPAARPRHSLVAAAAVTPGLVVVRSLTKTFALAGLRVGFLVAEPALVRVLARRQPHWSVGSLACAAAVACTSEVGRQHAAAVRADLPTRLEHLRNGLTACGLDVVPGPRAPFVLARHPGAAALRTGLRDKGFALRRGDTFPGLGPSWLRVAARDTALTDELVIAIAAIQRSLGDPAAAQHPRPFRSRT